jgi:anti-sigma factor RsiW
MECSKIQKKLSAYQDGELNSFEKEELARHLQGCRSCREEIEKLEQVWQSLGRLEEIRPDPWFYQGVVRRIRENPKPGLMRVLHHVFQVMGAPAVASILLVIGLAAGGYLGNDLARSGFSPSQSIPVSDSQSSFFVSMRVFDPAPPGTFAEGYLRMASHEEKGSR